MDNILESAYERRLGKYPNVLSFKRKGYFPVLLLFTLKWVVLKQGLKSLSFIIEVKAAEHELFSCQCCCLLW